MNCLRVGKREGLTNNSALRWTGDIRFLSPFWLIEVVNLLTFVSTVECSSTQSPQCRPGKNWCLSHQKTASLLQTCFRKLFPSLPTTGRETTNLIPLAMVVGRAFVKHFRYTVTSSTILCDHLAASLVVQENRLLISKAKNIFWLLQQGLHSGKLDQSVCDWVDKECESPEQICVYSCCIK